MHTIPFRAGSARYDVLLGAGLLAKLASSMAASPGAHRGMVFVITSPAIWEHWSEVFLASFRDGTPPRPLFVPAGEEHKRLATVERLGEELAAAGADRGSLLIAFGGGVIGDITGFLASIYMRGIEYVGVPSTLLAQVDASLGGKTGVNLRAGKNLMGSFHHPRLVVADSDLLRTLPDAELRAGLFECLKAGLIADRELFTSMADDVGQILARDPAALARVTLAAVRVKAAVVAEDERETGRRMILNFGHTVGHALEAATGFTALLHGEAVGWGMLAALQLSAARGLLRATDAERAATAVRAYGLPPLPALDPQELLARTAADKKNRNGQRRFVLLRGLGEAVVTEDVTDAELLSAVEASLKIAPEAAMRR